MKWLLGLMLLAGGGSSWAAPADWVRVSGVKGGLVVLLGCDKAEAAAELTAGNGYLVHALDHDPAKVATARATVYKQGKYGPIAVDTFDGKTLPYTDNAVNLVLVPESGCTVQATELTRVLAPRGVVLVRKAGNEKLAHALALPSAGLPDGFLKFTKPLPAGMDEWTHFLGRADNNAVSRDTAIAPPRRLQWQCGPLWSRSHETDMSMTGAVAANGRIVYFIDEGPIGIHETPHKSRQLPDKASLVGRDAFSGVELWRRPVPNWGSRAWDDNRSWGTGDQLWSSPWTLPRRLVAVGDHVFVTLGYRTFLSQLDAATGKTVREFKGLGSVDELLADDGKLILRVRKITAKGAKGAGDTVALVDIASGTVVWKKAFGRLVDLTLAASRGRVVFCLGPNVVALDMKTGDELWRARAASQAPTSLIMYEDTVLVAGGGRKSGISALSAVDGKLLWQRQGGRTSFRGPADLFAAGGMIWTGTLTTQGLDPKTGEVARKIGVPELFTAGHHSRCHRARGTPNYLLWSKRGVEFLDLKGDSHSRNDWVRGTCRYGFIPANGMLYMPPTPCFCYPGVKLNGFNALAPAGTAAPSIEERLTKGPAYGQTTGSKSQVSASQRFGISAFQHSSISAFQNWPTYRRDPARSGATACVVPTQLKEAWKTPVGGSCTPPVIADGRLVVADEDTHTVHCLEAATGKSLWSYIAGGLVDSPPTLHGGRVLFGCTDGRVYCLSLADGELVWRFHAAPYDRRIVSRGQVQSCWPVHGSVLVKNGVAYVVAGRSSFLDGGLHLYGLDAATGAVRCRNRMHGPHEDPARKSPHGAHWMDGGRSDILVCANNKLYMMQNVFDLELKQLEAPVTAPHGARKMERHLIASGGFLDTTGFDRVYWMHAALWPGLYYGALAPKTGQILVFDENTTYALHTFATRFSRSPYFAPGGEGHDLVADDNANEPILTEKAARREREPGHTRKAPPKWQAKVPIRARAMVLADKTLFIAGPPDKIDPADPLATFEGRGGALLRAVSTTDGGKLAQFPLDAQPVFDGLIAAGGKLYMTMQDGTVRCWGR